MGLKLENRFFITGKLVCVLIYKSGKLILMSTFEMYKKEQIPCLNHPFNQVITLSLS